MDNTFLVFTEKSSFNYCVDIKIVGITKIN